MCHPYVRRVSFAERHESDIRMTRLVSRTSRAHGESACALARATERVGNKTDRQREREREREKERGVGEGLGRGWEKERQEAHLVLQAGHGLAHSAAGLHRHGENVRAS